MCSNSFSRSILVTFRPNYQNKKPLKYKTIEGIWTEKGTPESVFNRLDYRFLYQEAPGIYTPPELTFPP